MGLYKMPLSMYLLSFGMGTMLARFQHAREECESKRAYLFWVANIKFVRTL